MPANLSPSRGPTFQLSSGDVDLALSLVAHAPTACDPNFTRVPLLADPLDVALPAGHALAAAAGLRLADLSGEPWIFGGSGPWSEITPAACEAAGSVPDQAHRRRAGLRSCRWSRRGWASR
jgi:DNA-binding transcriptional LysR family regulator